MRILFPLLKVACISAAIRALPSVHSLCLSVSSFSSITCVWRSQADVRVWIPRQEDTETPGKAYDSPLFGAEESLCTYICLFSGPANNVAILPRCFLRESFLPTHTDSSCHLSTARYSLFRRYVNQDYLNRCYSTIDTLDTLPPRNNYLAASGPGTHS